MSLVCVGIHRKCLRRLNFPSCCCVFTRPNTFSSSHGDSWLSGMVEEREEIDKTQTFLKLFFTSTEE